MARLVVFKDPSEIVELRDLLYGSIDQQKRGLTKAKAYQIRGHLPPSIHVTCLLLSAIHSDVPGTDFYAIRQTYAMGLIRFVNEMLDVYQVGRAVVPLHILASQMGLPSAFVELRHAATHEDLPSIYLLREMTNRALGWLMKNFWSKQRRTDNTLSESLTNSQDSPAKPAAKRQKHSNYPNSDANIEGLEINGCAERVKELFREWRRLKRSNSGVTPPTELVAALENEWENDEAEFLDVCLNKNVLVPTKNMTTERGIGQIVHMWLPLFQSMSDRACEALESVVVMALSGREWPVRKNEAPKLAILERWAIALAPYLSLSSANTLRTVPRPWNAQILAICAVRTGSTELYQSAAEMASLTGTDIVEFAQGEPEVPGWRKLKNWTPRPIGT